MTAKCEKEHSIFLKIIIALITQSLIQGVGRRTNAMFLYAALFSLASSSTWTPQCGGDGDCSRCPHTHLAGVLWDANKWCECDGGYKDMIKEPLNGCCDEGTRECNGIAGSGVRSPPWNGGAIPNADKCGEYWCCNSDDMQYNESLKGCCEGEQCSNGISGSDSWNGTRYTGAHKCSPYWCCNSGGMRYEEGLRACCEGEECHGIPNSDTWTGTNYTGRHRCGNFWCCDYGTTFDLNANKCVWPPRPPHEKMLMATAAAAILIFICCLWHHLRRIIIFGSARTRIPAFRTGQAP